MQLRSFLAFTALAGLSLGAACSDSTGLSGTGTLAVRLTDAPIQLDQVQRVDVYVVRVDIKQDETSDSTAANTSATDTTASAAEARDGWLTVAKPDSLFNLLDLQNGVSAALGSTTLTTGTYRMMRFVIDPDKSSITLTDGTVLTKGSSPGINFPSAAQSGIKVNFTQPLVVSANDTTTATADFDAAQSFVLRGSTIMSDGLQFKPVIRLKSAAQ
ncbi:MAG TPA: DUF4382 domain-containing protein [Gemmatimonadaceae bacterium]|nr:DUF4382 domain-containing protein [Gemmatimonadaceae bacterium]